MKTSNKIGETDNMFDPEQFALLLIWSILTALSLSALLFYGLNTVRDGKENVINQWESTQLAKIEAFEKGSSIECLMEITDRGYNVSWIISKEDGWKHDSETFYKYMDDKRIVKIPVSRCSITMTSKHNGKPNGS